jgi:potassium efflux system protein
VTETIKRAVDSMEEAEKTLREIGKANSDLGTLRNQIDTIISKTTKTADSLRPKLSDVESQIKKLGPPPAKDAPPESPTAAAERARLDAQASEVSSAIKTLEVTWSRARQAIDKITELRLQLFVRNLTQRMTSPVFPSFWARIAEDWPAVSWRLHYNASDWLRSAERKMGAVSLVIVLAVAIYLILKALAFRLTRFKPPSAVLRLSFFESAASAAWVAPIRAIPGVAVALGIYAAFNYIGLLYYPTAAPASISLVRSVLIYITVASLLNAVFAPHEPERRLMPLSTPAAKRVGRLLKLAAAIYTIDLFFSDVGQILYFPLSISIAQALVTSVAFAAVMIGLLLTPFERDDATGPTRRDTPRWIKIPLWISFVAIIATALLGYVAMSRFISQQIMMTGVIALVATLLYLAIRAFTREGTNGRNAASIIMEQRLGFDTTRRRQIAWLTETLLTIALALVAVPLVMLQWGFAAADIRDWIKQLLFGFEIGQFHISLVRIIIGIGIFIALLFATRIVQRRLRDNVLVQPKMDPGIANSIDTTVGYAGTIIAAIIAISYAGFDITNLAIVAGALSVGIGFGLQSIVNNFISGLILLIERPIKVGDWIVIGNEQGTVRKISVRSTEIETFDRASLIVPNSELITGRVLNWTHRNALGRIVMRFSAGPDVNPTTVLDVLRSCADSHPDILSEPAPLAMFEGYTSTATEYSLRVLLPDITRGLRIQSDLRVAIFDALREKGITPPLLQLKVQAASNESA